jgi:hypothetical protein
MSVSHRSSHYWLWFLVFGVIPLISAAMNGFPANTTSFTAYWLVGTGLLGLLLGSKNINDGKLSQPYDLIVGVIFALAGIVGILGYFHVSTGGAANIVQSVGLSLAGLYPLLFIFLGLKSIHHGLGKG